VLRMLMTIGVSAGLSDKRPTKVTRLDLWIDDNRIIIELAYRRNSLLTA
jgi:hypothetical protein